MGSFHAGSALKGNIIVAYHIMRRGSRSSHRTRTWRAARLLRIILAPAFAPPAEQDHIFSHNFSRVDFLAVLVVVTIVAKPALHIDVLPFGQVRGDIFTAPQHDTAPVGFLLPFPALLILPAAVRGHGKLRDGGLRRRVGRLSIPSQMPD